MTPARSTIKPYQALAILEAKTFDKYDFDDADLALMCSSHSSEDKHVERAKRMMLRIAETGNEQSHLACGGHASISSEGNALWFDRAYHPQAIDNNCSGKHVGMLAAALALNVNPRGYEQPAHPVQHLVMRVIQREVGREETVTWGIDGCNLPTPAIRLSSLARLYATLGNAKMPVSSDQGDSSPGITRSRHLHRIYRAMAKHPDQVSGIHRFDYNLARVFGFSPSISAPNTQQSASLVGKVGADGVFIVAVPQGHHAKTIPAELAFGIAVKVEDGNEAATYTAVVEIMRQLGMLSEQRGQNEDSTSLPLELEFLKAWSRPARKNTAGREVGQMWAAFQLAKSQNA